MFLGGFFSFNFKTFCHAAVTPRSPKEKKTNTHTHSENNVNLHDSFQSLHLAVMAALEWFLLLAVMSLNFSNSILL